MKMRYFSKEDWPYYALGIEILKGSKIHVFLLIARNYRGARSEPGSPVLIVMGGSDTEGSFRWEIREN